MSGVFRTIDPPPPLHPARVSSPRTKGRGVYTRQGKRGWGVNISEDARHWIGLLQYNPTTVFGHNVYDQMTSLLNVYRDRNLGQNPDKNLKSFPPCYSQSGDFYFFKLAHNILKILQFSYCTQKRRKEKNLIENHTLFHLILEIHTVTSSLRILKIMPRNLNETVRS